MHSIFWTVWLIRMAFLLTNKKSLLKTQKLHIISGSLCPHLLPFSASHTHSSPSPIPASFDLFSDTSFLPSHYPGLSLQQPVTDCFQLPAQIAKHMHRAQLPPDLVPAPFWGKPAPTSASPGSHPKTLMGPEFVALTWSLHQPGCPQA